MPRKSPYLIDLSKHEREVIEATARRYTAPYRDVLRAKIILLASQNYDNDQIASRLDTPRQIVSKWRKRYYESGLAGLQDIPRGGRPSSFSHGGNR